jgi:hypothetical protein
MFSRYKEVQEQKKFVKHIRPSPLLQINVGNDILFYSMRVIFLSVLFARAKFFIKFPFFDTYFRLLILGAMVWLGFGIVPRAAALFVRLERETDKSWGLDGF